MRVVLDVPEPTASDLADLCRTYGLEPEALVYVALERFLTGPDRRALPDLARRYAELGRPRIRPDDPGIR